VGQDAASEAHHCSNTNVGTQWRKPTAQMAHLIFSDTKANAEKPKEPFLVNAQTD